MRTLIRAAALVALLSPLAAGAQQWRTVESARQLGDAQQPLNVIVKYAAGKLDLAPLDEPLLYQMRIRYDEQVMDAVHEYDASQHRLELGLDGANVGWRALRGMKKHEGGSMSLGLSPQVPMNLELALGGVDADLELGGLRIRKLKLESGMAGVKLDFSRPNLVPMSEMSIDVGLGGVKLENLGNANVSAISIDGGLGGVVLDFGDVVTQDVKIRADIAFGELRINVPPNVGVMVDARVRGGKFERNIGFTRDGANWFSMNWKQASHRITIVSETTLGSLRIGPTGQ
jgi:hypothetical protein